MLKGIDFLAWDGGMARGGCLDGDVGASDL